MNFLLINDDGIDAEGIKALCRALSKKGRVFVFAPEKQQSGKSLSLTLRQDLTGERVKFDNAELAYSISGTPADCTKIGLTVLKDKKIEVDVVFAGINMGANLGLDTLYSGTIGAAREASLNGYHAVAVSVSSHHASEFGYACKIATSVLDYIKEIPTDIILSVNTPNLPEKEIKGLKFSSLGDRYYTTGFEISGEDRLTIKEVFTGLNNDNPRGDVKANEGGFATITPLRNDGTDLGWLKRIKKANIG